MGKAKRKRRYAQVGVGGRSKMYTNALLDTYKDSAMLVGICDLNQTRMDFCNKEIVEKYGARPVPTYKHTDFDRMIKETKPDTVIVTTVDRTHHIYICRAMELGCDVISEKPMTTDEEKCQQIIDTQRRTGRKVTVTFNYRYAPRNTALKRLLQSGEIGEIISVHFEWLLDTKHGADYFRRWHRDKRNSGGLMVHKATHHFDLVNWWLDSYPVEVYGIGRLAFYGRDNAERRGVTRFYYRCHGSENAKGDPFAINLEDSSKSRALYLEAEKEDGYLRDRSVFSDGISIEDTMGLVVQYENKAIMTYSLNAFCPWEGYRIMFNGTKGRVEMEVVERPYLSGTKVDQNDPSYAETKKEKAQRSERLTVQLHWGTKREVPIVKGEGGHGGGDRRLLDDVFNGAKDDPLKTAADFIDGARSILTGIAANKAFERKVPIYIKDLVRLPIRDTVSK